MPATRPQQRRFRIVLHRFSPLIGDFIVESDVGGSWSNGVMTELAEGAERARARRIRGCRGCSIWRSAFPVVAAEAALDAELEAIVALERSIRAAQAEQLRRIQRAHGYAHAVERVHEGSSSTDRELATRAFVAELRQRWVRTSGRRARWSPTPSGSGRCPRRSTRSPAERSASPTRARSSMRLRACRSPSSVNSRSLHSIVRHA